MLANGEIQSSSRRRADTSNPKTYFLIGRDSVSSVFRFLVVRHHKHSSFVRRVHWLFLEVLGRSFELLFLELVLRVRLDVVLLILLLSLLGLCLRLLGLDIRLLLLEMLLGLVLEFGALLRRDSAPLALLLHVHTYKRQR